MRWLLAAGLLLAQLGTAVLLRGVKSPEPLEVAYAIFVTDLNSEAWQDAMAVMAYSLKKAKAKSRHRLTALVLAPDRLPDDKKDMLLSFGFDDVLRKPVPVEMSEIQNEVARREMGHTQGTGKGLTFALHEETIKYWGLAQTQFDRVLVLDADTLILDPMDEIMELKEDFVGTYDHGVDCCGPDGGILSSKLPPVQGGFLLFRPNATDFEAVKALTREGDWRGGAGWKGSFIGYFYGGIGPDGLLQYYFNKDALGNAPQKREDHRELDERIDQPSLPGSRMKPIDRDVYDVLVQPRLSQDLQGVAPETVHKRVKSAHFTGGCVKPWGCFTPSDPHGLCTFLHDEWWKLWAEVAAQRTNGSDVSGSHCKKENLVGAYFELPRA